jgi:hypothetical protein
LYPLNPEATPEDVESVREVVRSQMTELVKEFAFPSGPRVSRVNSYFTLLLLAPKHGPLPTFPPPGSIVTDSDSIVGTLGNLRDVFGMSTLTASGKPNPLVNSIADETDTTNFRVISDYMTSLMQSWITNLPFFNLGIKRGHTFLGTQLVLISRQLSVTSELVDEVRFTLDSVFLGPAERQTMLLNFPAPYDPMFLEDLLSWVQQMVVEEAPGLIQTGGKFGLYQVEEMASRQHGLLIQTQAIAASPGAHHLPVAFSAPRVTIALQNLSSQLGELVRLARAVATRYLPVSPR